MEAFKDKEKEKYVHLAEVKRQQDFIDNPQELIGITPSVDTFIIPDVAAAKYADKGGNIILLGDAQYNLNLRKLLLSSHPVVAVGKISDDKNELNILDQVVLKYGSPTISSFTFKDINYVMFTIYDIAYRIKAEDVEKVLPDFSIKMKEE